MPCKAILGTSPCSSLTPSKVSSSTGEQPNVRFRAIEGHTQRRSSHSQQSGQLCSSYQQIVIGASNNYTLAFPAAGCSARHLCLCCISYLLGCKTLCNAPESNVCQCLKPKRSASDTGLSLPFPSFIQCKKDT